MPAQPHFLLVTYGAQGHINPCRHLARHLAATIHARVTISTSVYAHRQLFPPAAHDSCSDHDQQQQPPEADDHLISYIPYSDGTEEGLNFATHGTEVRLRTIQSLTQIASELDASGRPVTCIIYALVMTLAVDVARQLSVPCLLFWIQPAATFAIYHHFFNHGYADAVINLDNTDDANIELPWLPPLRISDLPSFLTVHRSESNPYRVIYNIFQRVFELLNKEAAGTGPRRRPIVLVNTFHELEARVLTNLLDDVELVSVGPLVPPGLLIGDDLDQYLAVDHGSPGGGGGGDLFEHDSSAGYMEWLESKAEKSVVYVSFGSLAVLAKEQVEEIRKGLQESGRPYLWVIRKGNQDDHKEESNSSSSGGACGASASSSDHDHVQDHSGPPAPRLGIVVEWCNQAKVLSHPSVGCFVTHCGWNSVLESVVSGVPMVLLPQFGDQNTNAMLVEREWGVGVRAHANSETGIVESQEVRRCLDLVMSNDDDRSGTMIRSSAELWKGKARAALSGGGSSTRNFSALLDIMRL